MAKAKKTTKKKEIEALKKAKGVEEIKATPPPPPLNNDLPPSE